MKSNSSPTAVAVRSNCVLLPGCHTMMEVCFFTKFCELFSLLVRFEGQNVVSHPVSKCQCRKRCQELYFFQSRMNRDHDFFIDGLTLKAPANPQHDECAMFTCEEMRNVQGAMTCCPQGNWLVPFLPLSSRIYDTKSPLLRKHFSTQDDSLYHFVGSRIPLSFLSAAISMPHFFRSWTQKRPVSLRESHRVIPDFSGICNTFLIILSF